MDSNPSSIVKAFREQEGGIPGDSAGVSSASTKS